VKNLTEFIVKNIVNHPDDVVVTEEKEDEGIIVKIKVHPEDIARVIGKEGKIIRSIKNLVKVAARKNNLWVNIEIVEL
jgi:predicted RNA-binding protein YlqC (UPF0109 family)